MIWGLDLYSRRYISLGKERVVAFKVCVAHLQGRICAYSNMPIECFDICVIS